MKSNSGNCSHNVSGGHEIQKISLFSLHWYGFFHCLQLFCQFKYSRAIGDCQVYKHSKLVDKIQMPFIMYFFLPFNCLILRHRLPGHVTAVFLARFFSGGLPLLPFKRSIHPQGRIRTQSSNF